MGAVLRQFAGPAVAFLVGLGFEVSNIEVPWLAWLSWAVAALWALYAVITWGPVRSWLPSFTPPRIEGSQRWRARQARLEARRPRPRYRFPQSWFSVVSNPATLMLTQDDLEAYFKEAERVARLNLAPDAELAFTWMSLRPYPTLSFLARSIQADMAADLNLKASGDTEAPSMRTLDSIPGFQPASPPWRTDRTWSDLIRLAAPHTKPTDHLHLSHRDGKWVLVIRPMVGGLPMGQTRNLELSDGSIREVPDT